MKSNPILLDTLDSSGRILQRLESCTGDAKDEAWLQNLIFRHPQLLPVSMFERGESALDSRFFLKKNQTGT